ncbi:hypothetical protein O3M35_009589 [Rhynocoris fuscipes]|uniref:Cytochrome P450 n=1 Tax=Rhynocoris fuscipes TaxID=488301 RepID=A0AAW1DAG4_9HEMI
MFVTVLLIGLVAVLFHWGVLRNYSYWKRKRVPHLPGSFPYGTMKDISLIKKYQGHNFDEIYQKLSPHPFGGAYIWNKPVLFLRDPEVIKIVMVKEFQHFRSRGRVELSEKEPLSMHLFSLEEDLWRAVRLKLAPTFTSGRLKHMFSIFEDAAKKMDGELLKIIKKGEPVNIKEVVTCFTLDTITSCAFGLEPNTADNEEFLKTSKKIFLPYVPLKLKVKIALALMFPFLKKFYRFNFVDQEVEHFLINMVKNTVKYREENNIRRNDFLDLMIQLKNKGKLENESKEASEAEKKAESTTIEFTPSLLAAQCFVFFAAGFETSSSVQSYGFYELAMNQDIQDRLRKEIDEVCEKYGGKLTYQALSEMTYLDQVISEVIRKYPTLPFLERKCTKQYSFPNYPEIVIEEGTKIYIPVYSLHHDPKYFPNPDKFDPDRFSAENKSSITPYTYLPFGEGPRYCIGMRFGQLQTRMGIASILKKYKVLPNKDTPSKLSFVGTGLVTTVSGPIKLVLEPRDD